MQMMTNDCVKTESHNHAKGVGNRGADLSDLGKKLLTRYLRLKTKQTEYKHCALVSKCVFPRGETAIYSATLHVC